MTTFPRSASLNKWEISPDVFIVNVHKPELCQGEFCVIHNPSQHHMREWPLNWRENSWVSIKDPHFERICPCGVGHPDPDDLQYHLSLGRDYMAVHGCCGCCRSLEAS